MAHEFDGVKYAKVSAHQREWGKRVIDELDLSGGESILDLGCGDGFLTAFLAEHVPEGTVTGIDASFGMIEAAGKHKIFNLAFYIKDINELDYVSEFDLIFSSATLHWVHDHKRLLYNCHCALKPRGRIRFNFAADGNCSNFNETVLAMMQDERFSMHFTNFHWPWYMPKLEEYERLAMDSEFRETKVWGENMDRYFPTVDALIGWINQPAIVPFLSGMHEENDKMAFREAIINRMIERTRRSDGTCFETFRRINISAIK
ncbi:MAG: methyltransferase domain-containing protein [Deltaproteobacteria bacterium]|nr:methyltransferase domain-containing protein [Deltaproteobacteria bacterium]